jgi:hypothetical protein
MLRKMCNKSNNIGRPLAILAVLGVASIASAATQLHFDLNAVTITAVPAVTSTNYSTYTGVVTLSDNSSSYLEGIDIDGVDQDAVGTLTAVSGTMNYTGGAISSSPASNLTFTIENADSSLHTYTSSFDELDFENDGTVSNPLIFGNGDANPSYLDSTNFAGVNVSQWALQDLDGAAIISNFPGTTGNLDVYIVPEPVLGLVSLIGLAGLRIRSRKL